MSSAPATRDLANAIRALSMDAVQKANSGHPGAPMGMADIAEVLWRGFMKHNPDNPHWADRDRFVLSNGHGSMLLYSLLHLTGYGVSLDDIKNFRQLGSPTAGHPEFGDAPGIETTTGPLGQGIANAVGMALAEKVLAAQFNRDGHDIVDHYTYCFLGDGCMMEGISHEVSSLAGTLGLGKLVAFYDDNGISIDGEVDGWFTDDTVERFRAYRYADVGRQCLRSVAVPVFDQLDELTCGNMTGPSSLPMGCASHLVTDSPAVCEAACVAHASCAGFTRVVAGQPYSGGPAPTDVGIGACFFMSDVSQTNEASTGTSCYRRPADAPALPRVPAPNPPPHALDR